MDSFTDSLKPNSDNKFYTGTDLEGHLWLAYHTSTNGKPLGMWSYVNKIWEYKGYYTSAPLNLFFDYVTDAQDYLDGVQVWVGCTKDHIFVLANDSSVLVNTDSPLLYATMISGCTYEQDLHILTLSTDNGLIEYELTFDDNYVSLHLGHKYYEPFNERIEQNLVS